MQRQIFVPDFFVSKRNLFIQILFTTIFVYAFINIYLPFGVGSWYNVDIWRFRFYSLLIVLSGMLIVIISRIILYQISRRNQIGIFLYGTFIAIEVLLMSAFYALMGYFVPEDNTHSFLSLFFLAIYNTVLLLLIPYLLTLLYFSWEENRFNLESIKEDMTQRQFERNGFIPFYDENGTLRITIKQNDIYYLAANDNYVIIHYVNNGVPRQFLLRNTLKRLEQKLERYHVIRCHRSYMVNTRKINVIQKTRKGLSISFDAHIEERINVSPTYMDRFKMLYQ